jgi:hypothetical protein
MALLEFTNGGVSIYIEHSAMRGFEKMPGQSGTRLLGFHEDILVDQTVSEVRDAYNAEIDRAREDHRDLLDALRKVSATIQHYIEERFHKVR